jgi:hypothetical protein
MVSILFVVRGARAHRFGGFDLIHREKSYRSRRRFLLNRASAPTLTEPVACRYNIVAGSSYVHFLFGMTLR